MLLKGGLVYDHGALVPMDVLMTDGRVSARARTISPECAEHVLDVRGLAVFPGLVDVHVHLREPGFSYKETIASGTRAAAAGGYTTVCAMPNLSPAPDTPEHLNEEATLIRRDAAIRVLPYGCITMGQQGWGEVTDMAAMAPHVAGFSDDGRGVRDENTMREAMRRCHGAGSLIAAHCEDMTLIPKGGAIHAGSYAAAHDIPGIPSESEWRPIERDLRLVRETGCRYHVCHVSCRESVELIRKAQTEGLDVTCETGPHYLLLTQNDLMDDGRFKMNPPLRNPDDRAALLEGVQDGTVGLIATDHAPHSAEEKSRGLRQSLMGIVGIETAFPLLYTYLVKRGLLTLPQLIDRMSDAPRRRFGLDGGLAVGDRAEVTVFDLNAPHRIDPDAFCSMGHATPFAGWSVDAACRLTICGDRIAWNGLEGGC